MIIAICDDEIKYRDEIKGYVADYFSDKGIAIDIVCFSSGEELIASKQKFDIVFLDIEMNDMNGIEVAKAINAKSRHTIIFIVTAYHKYLDDAMDLNVFRYIDKPISRDRLFAGLDKAIALIDNNDITFRTIENQIITISKNDIMYIEVAKKRVTVTTIDNEYITRERMDFFRDSLTASHFAIPHNSYIVNFNYVAKFKRDEMVFKNNHTISIAPRKQIDIKKQFVQFVGEGY